MTLLIKSKIVSAKWFLKLLFDNDIPYSANKIQGYLVEK